MLRYKRRCWRWMFSGATKSKHHASSSKLLIKIKLLCSTPRAHVTYMKLPRALRVSQLTFYARRVPAFSARYRHRAKTRALSKTTNNCRTLSNS